MNSAQPPSFWSLAAAEPFRIFFPLGALFGISGVSLWPLYFLGIHQSFYPGVMHARIMIEGFMGAFVIGFLATAFPRLLGARQFSRGELFLLLGLFLPAIGLHIGHQHLLGDIAFLLVLLTLGAFLLGRFRTRADSPPPTFRLVVGGFANAVIGSALLVAAGLGYGLPWTFLLGNSLLYEGFLLYLILGIGGFLLPRFLGAPVPNEDPAASSARGWWLHAGAAGVVGLVLLGTFVADAIWPWSKAAAIARCAAAAVFLLSQLRGTLFRSGPPLVTCFKVSLILLVFGLAFPALWPHQRVAGLHVVFIGGFTLITFAVATRVVLGHSGQSARFHTGLPFIIGTTALMIVAAVLRFVGDFQAEARGSILSHAAHAWMLGAAIWSWRVLPSVRSADPAGDEA